MIKLGDTLSKLGGRDENKAVMIKLGEA